MFMLQKISVFKFLEFYLFLNLLVKEKTVIEENKFVYRKF